MDQCIALLTLGQLTADGKFVAVELQGIKWCVSVQHPVQHRSQLDEPCSAYACTTLEGYTRGVPRIQTDGRGTDRKSEIRQNDRGRR